MTQDSDPDVRTIHKIAWALGVPVSSFFEPPALSGFDAERRHRLQASLQELVALTPTISKAEMLKRMMALIAGLSETDRGAPNRGVEDEGKAG